MNIQLVLGMTVLFKLLLLTYDQLLQCLWSNIFFYNQELVQE